MGEGCQPNNFSTAHKRHTHDKKLHCHFYSLHPITKSHEKYTKFCQSKIKLTRQQWSELYIKWSGFSLAPTEMKL